jgi:hypothetical protein
VGGIRIARRNKGRQASAVGAKESQRTNEILFCVDPPSKLPWALELKLFAERASVQSSSNWRSEQAEQVICLHSLEVNACTIVDARGEIEPIVIKQPDRPDWFFGKSG